MPIPIDIQSAKSVENTLTEMLVGIDFSTFVCQTIINSPATRWKYFYSIQTHKVGFFMTICEAVITESLIHRSASVQVLFYTELNSISNVTKKSN